MNPKATDWNSTLKVEELKTGLKVGEKVASYSLTCSRYAGIVGEFVGLEDIGGYTMAKVHYPPVKEYEKYTYEFVYQGVSSSYNPYHIYKNEFDAHLPLNGIYILDDQSIEAGTVLHQ